MIPDDGGEPDGTGNSGSGAGGSVGPAADSTKPTFDNVSFSPKYPGPNTLMNVSAVVLDEDSNLNITVHYGFDNKTWKNVTQTNTSTSIAAFTDRNPSSGSTRSTLTKTYDIGSYLAELYVTIWSSDADTMHLRVRGQKAGSSTWYTVYSQTGLRNGNHQFKALLSNQYVTFEIYLRDTEGNDAIYYNCTYKAQVPKYSAILPPAKTKNKMYAFFNVTDSSNNTNESKVLDWTIDRTAPKIKDLSTYKGVHRGYVPAPINVNVTDNGAAEKAFLNWSDDNSTWNLVEMSYVSGFESPIHFRGFIPVPSKNKTIYYRVIGYDQGGNMVKSQNKTFQWNPPPAFTDVNHHPYYVNNRTNVTLSAIVTDSDNVSSVWVRYSASGIPWTRINGTKVGNNYSVVLPKIAGSTAVHYQFYANDSENGTSKTTTISYGVDETIPKMNAIWKDLQIIGPKDTVDVVGYFKDDNPIINVTLQYGYDNKTWSNVSTSRIPGWLTVDDRNPASGTVRGQTLSKTYQMNGTLKFLYLYVYSSDSDTLHIDIEGYNDDTSQWERIYYQHSYSPGNGVRVNTWFLNKNYTSWRISYYDYDNNDDIYYNCTYVDDAIGDGGTIPPAGNNSKVYYRFNVTDAAKNYLTTNVYSYDIDSTPPTIVNHSIPTTLHVDTTPIPVYANLTDAIYLRSAHLNWSTDNITWSQVPMAKLSGDTFSGQFRGYLPYPDPAQNSTYYVRVEGYDYPYNLGQSSIVTFSWNPPPWIDNIRRDPNHANNSTSVDITARVWDADGVDNVYVTYMNGSSTWIRINATQGTGDDWSVTVPAINDTKWVRYIIYATDKKAGSNQTVTLTYHIDEVLPTIHTPYTVPTYANASIPIWLMANVTDFVGIDNITLYYRIGNASFTTTNYLQASDRDALTVAAWLRVDDAGYFDGLYRLGDRLGTWNGGASGMNSSPPAAFWTSADALLLDGSSSSFAYTEAITAAGNGAFVVTDRNTFFSARAALGYPSYTIHRSQTWYSYGITVGRGAIVYTHNLWSYNYLGRSYETYTNDTLETLALHLQDVHHRFMPYGALIPKTVVSATVEYKYHVTDLSGLSFMSDLYNYTADGLDPVVTSDNGAPSPPLLWVNETYSVWIDITDDTFILGGNLVYSFDNGTNWTTLALGRTSGTDTSARWSSTVPAPYSHCYVWYYFQVWDRAGNYIVHPSSSFRTYRSTDMPLIENIHTTPTIINATGSATVSATVTDSNGISSVNLVYRQGMAGSPTTVSMTQGTGDNWTGTIGSPGVTTRLYFYISATENLGYTVNTTDRYIIVDADKPFFTTSGWSPTYPNATNATQVTGTGNDGLSSMDMWLDYKWGPSGAINSTYMGLGAHQEVTDRYPPTGTTTTTINRFYDMTSGSYAGRVTLRIYSADHASCYVYLRGLTGTTWEYILSPTTTTDGIKVDQSVLSRSYTRLHVYFYDTNRDPFYMNLTYTNVDTDLTATVPAPTFSTTVYYRFRGTDQVGNSNESAWDSYWADGTKPYVAAHKSPGVRDSMSDVLVQATFADESKIDRAQIFYSYGTQFYWVNMTPQLNNGTHLGATATVPQTSIPLKVTYYFRFFDAAGNNKTSKTYSFTTKMRNINEGVFQQFDSSVLESEAVINKWEWDFDYNGTFNVDRTNQVVRYRYYDHGDYTIMLKVYDKGGNVTNITFPLTVMDLSPTAGIIEIGTVVEGTTVALDASYSSSWPDAIVSYEWDLSYDGTTFNAEATGVLYNHTMMFDGTFKIGLRVTDDDDSIGISDIDIVVTDGKPTLDIDFPTKIEEGVVFTLNATGTISWPDDLDRIEWDLDYDGTFTNETDGLLVNHSYLDDGTYRFMARAYDSDGSMTQLIGTITVTDMSPIANITALSQVDEGTPLDLDGTGSTSYPDDMVAWEWDFHYDGSFDTEDTGNMTNFTYLDNGTYTVALRVWDDDGSSTLTTFDVDVLDLEPVASIVAPATVNEGDLITFSMNATSWPDKIVRMDWDFFYDGVDFEGDASGEGVEHDYLDNGTYIIAIRVVDDDGSTIIETATIRVIDLGPTANATIIGDFIEGHKLILDGRPSVSYPDDIVSWEWDMDYDGETFETLMASDVDEHTYMDHGTYTIALRVTDDDGSVNIFTRTVEITDVGPEAIITVAVLFHSEGSLVTFSAGSSTSYPDELVAYHWDWEGDGVVDETTMEVNGRHTFTKPGRYEVILTVEDDDGTTDNTSVMITITDVGPTARLDADPTPEGEEVTLDASGTEEPGSDFIAFRWDLDGDMVWDVENTCSTLVRTWNEPGMYDITMQVEDEDGSKSSKGITLIIQDVAPVADTGGPYEFDEGDLVTLDASDSHEPGRHFTTFKWDLDGDGAFDAEGMELEWTFTLAGEYTIKLLVEDEDGSTGEATTNLVVLDVRPQFVINLPSDVQENVPANFTLDDLFDPGTEEFTVIWTFGDGETAKGVTVQHVYLEQGTYSGTLTIEDNDGTVWPAAWPREITVVNSAPVVELSTLVLEATEDSQFTISVFGHDTVNDVVTYDVKGPGGKIDEETGVFKWTPLDEHVGRNKFTFMAIDEDGGVGEYEAIITVEDVDNDFFGLPFAVGLGIVIAVVVSFLLAFFIITKRRKEVEDEVIEPEGGVDLESEVSVDLEDLAAAPTAGAVAKPAPEAKPPKPEAPPKRRPPEGRPPPKKRPPEGRPPRKKRPPGAPPRKKRPPGAPPRKRPPGAPPPKKRPPGAPPRKRPPGAPPRKRPPGAPPPKKRPPGAPPRKRPPGAPPRKRPPGAPPPKKRPPGAPPPKRKKRPPAP